MTESRKLAGVLGGMGPDATVDFMQKVIRLTPAENDQDHVRLLVDQNPHVPDRQAAIRGDGASPGPILAAMASQLEASGADFLVMPCNAAHVFAGDIVSAVSIPFVSLIDLCLDIAEASGATNIGLLATTGLVEARVYQDGIEGRGLGVSLPSDDEQDELMDLINTIKAGNISHAVTIVMQRLANTLIERGAQAIIAGCTEIPLVLEAHMITVPLIASTDELARKTVELANE